MNQPLIRAGRPASQPTLHAPNAALLIDFDNVTLGIQGNLTKELRTLLNSDIIKGKVAVQRAYADWRRYPQYIVSLSESSIDLIFAPAFGSAKKNATDIRLAVDAVELVFTRPEIGTFILLSGDSDFSSLVLKLKEYGKYVIGVGIRESASDLLIQNCDEYYSYTDLAGLTSKSDLPTVARDPWELAREAVQQMERNGDVMRSDRLKQVMQQIDPNFDERDIGFNRFSKFVLEAAQRGLMQATKLDNGQYEVASVAGAVPAAAPAAAGAEKGGRPAGEEGARRSSRRRGRGRGGERGEPRGEGRGEAREGRSAAAESPNGRSAGLTLARAFHLMSEALGALGGAVTQDTLRARMVAMNGREDPLLEEGRFLKLLRQANDAEVADVRKVDESTYEVSAGGATPARPAARAQENARTSQPAPERAESAETPAAAASGAAEAGAVRDGESAQRRGLRFRRGSRAPMRSADIPLVGVVKIETPTQAEPAAQEEAAPTRKRATRKRAGSSRKKATKSAASGAATAPAEGAASGEEPAAKPKRKRSRKKATKASAE